MAAKPITIVGGGLAGLTLGIGLRRCGVPVTVWEAGHYPRHRVCGEFISGRGQETLSRFGLRELLERAGAVNAGTAAFFSATQSTPPRSLPARAICLSRFTMDHTLAVEFRRLGGELLEDQRRRAEDFGEGIVRATGRRTQTEENGSRWFGLKAHARNVSLTADLEMHVSPRGYVGLCRVNGGAVNVCGLFRRRAGMNDSPQKWREWLRGQTGSPLSRRLAAAEFDESSFCAVAGISLRPQRAATRAECCVGDAITMIPPVTGNGMSMAFESAELAVEPLAAWSHGEISWTQTRQTLARRCDAAFARRLAWAKWLQRMMLAPSLQNVLVRFVSRSEWFWRTAFERTR
ncbi:MAG: FAD-dependent monooxygenase [Verrucomicrobiota bacterium]|jgi:2-polyprenyl-6-methoxyphenol hydroxylase-like FAD-dependent oxidoreductase